MGIHACCRAGMIMVLAAVSLCFCQDFDLRGIVRDAASGTAILSYSDPEAGAVPCVIGDTVTWSAVRQP